MQNKGKLVIISGPSAGVGKDTIVRMFRSRHPDWLITPSFNTRKPRVGEVDGVDYWFISQDEFKRKFEAGDFIETMHMTNNDYGTPKQPMMDLLEKGKNVILRKDPPGALAIKKAIPESIIIFLIPESLEILEEQFRGRGTDSEDFIQDRLKKVKRELSYQDQFDFKVVNPYNKPEEAVTGVEKAVGLI